jgi:hypothetical protein
MELVDLALSPVAKDIHQQQDTAMSLWMEDCANYQNADNDGGVSTEHDTNDCNLERVERDDEDNDDEGEINNHNDTSDDGLDDN